MDNKIRAAMILRYNVFGGCLVSVCQIADLQKQVAGQILITFLGHGKIFQIVGYVDFCTIE